jgi:hypothetical protein
MGRSAPPVPGRCATRSMRSNSPKCCTCLSLPMGVRAELEQFADEHRYTLNGSFPPIADGKSVGVLLPPDRAKLVQPRNARHDSRLGAFLI